MKLKDKCFDYAYQLTNFINDNNIPKENIQCIIPRYSCYILFYWE